MRKLFGSRFLPAAPWAVRSVVNSLVLMLLLLPVVLTGCAGDGNVAPTAELPAVPADYRLDSGDHLRIQVLDQQELSGEYTINGAGVVSLPLIGSVKAGGLTPKQLEQEIADGLSPKYLRNPSVSVEVLSYRPFYILGEVKNPGSYPYVNGMTAINAVALAGGFSYRAREDEFYIARGGEKHRRKYLGHPDTPLMPGDVVTIRERYF